MTFIIGIFRNSPGHLRDTPANRKLLESIGNNPAFTLGKDKYGNTWYAQTRADGTQIWVRVRAEKITNGGVNSIPKEFHPQVGLCTPEVP
jgi:filamentous hemagglutinin